MKILIAAVFAVFLPILAMAGPFKKNPAKLDERILKAAERLSEMQADPRKRIPASLIADARGIIILHKAKAGLGVGVEAGNGVALVRDVGTGQWSAPGFIASAEGSYGFQIGAQESDIILLLMNEAGLKPLKGANFNVGVDVEAVAGPADKGAQIDSSSITSPVLVYSNADGLFAGASVRSGGIIPAEKNNRTYYGADLAQIVFGKTPVPTESGRRLIATIEKFSGRTAQTAPRSTAPSGPAPQQSTGY